MNCTSAMDLCMCSNGCQSKFLCKASHLCDVKQPKQLPYNKNLYTYMFFMTFNSSLVRNKFYKNPITAYKREYNRITWAIKSLKAVNSNFPIHIVVGGERFESYETKIKSYAEFLYADVVAPPKWASKWHKLSFNKISALRFQQFEKIMILDNDIVVLKNIDHLFTAPTPSAVFHHTVGNLYKHTKCSVTSGLLIISPSLQNFETSITWLKNTNRSTFDGGDEEFWLWYFRDTYIHELPLRYHIHRALPITSNTWSETNMLHLISNFRRTNEKNIGRQFSQYEKYF